MQQAAKKKLSILFWGTYDISKPRVRHLISELRRAGHEVWECHADIWQGHNDKSTLDGWRIALSILRMLAAYPKLLLRYFGQKRHDAVIISYPGILDALVLWPFAAMLKLPVVWDVYIPAYEAVVEDRRLVSPASRLAKLLHAGEWFAARAARRLFLDTDAHARYFEKEYALPAGSVGRVMVGSELTSQAAAENTRFTVLYFGQFIPLHGVSTIIEAARILRGEDIEFQLVGSGQEAAAIEQDIESWSLGNVVRRAWLERSELARVIATADLCLGVFGDSPKASRVIPHKLFDIVACRRPLVTRDSPAVREFLSENEAVALVPPANPQALAAAIMRFRRQPGHYDASLFPSVDIAAQLEMFLDRK